MKAAAALVLEKDIDWHKALLAWRRTLLGECLDHEEIKGIIYRAGRKLRVGETPLKALVRQDPVLQSKCRSLKPKKGEQK
ncbi:MAG TPA: hypothetical protein VHW72_03290 [Candidatus Angelobacter sp.]|jgi:hypothetical protein|nr:hypothetical protein [Candidatus Angelobacter sp.]